MEPQTTKDEINSQHKVKSIADQLQTGKQDGKWKKKMFVLKILMLVLLIAGLSVSIGFNIYYSIYYSGFSIQQSSKQWFVGCSSNEYKINLEFQKQTPPIIISPLPDCLKQNLAQLAKTKASYQKQYQKVGSQLSDDISIIGSVCQIVGFLLIFA